MIYTIINLSLVPKITGFAEITGNTSLAPRDFILMKLIGVGIVPLILFTRDRSLRDQLFSEGSLMIEAKIIQVRKIIGLISIILNKYYYNLKYILRNTAKSPSFTTTTILSSVGYYIAVGLTVGLPPLY